MSLRCMFPAALAGAALAAAASAQDWKGLGRLEGKVVDGQGQPVAGATVTLELPGRGSTALTTDKKGRWAIGGIAAGTWNLDVAANGYVTRRLFVPLPMESSRVPPVQVTLDKAAPQGPPPEVLAAIRKGDDAYKAGRYAEARQEYEKLLGLRPDLALTIHEQIARCYSQEENYEKELVHLQHLLDADPTNTGVRLLMAQEALKGGLLDRGLELLGAVDEGRVSDPNIYFNIAVLLLNQQQSERALPYLTKAVALDPTYVDGYFQRGLTHLGLARYAEAKADLAKVIELAPDGPQAATARAALDQLK